MGDIHYAVGKNDTENDVQVVAVCHSFFSTFTYTRANRKEIKKHAVEDRDDLRKSLEDVLTGLNSSIEANNVIFVADVNLCSPGESEFPSCLFDKTIENCLTGRNVSKVLVSATSEVVSLAETKYGDSENTHFCLKGNVSEQINSLKSPHPDSNPSVTNKNRST